MPERVAAATPKLTERNLTGLRRVLVTGPRLGSFLLRVLSHLSKNHALLLAGGIAYNLLLSIVPLLTVLLVGLTHVLDRQQLLDIVRGQLVLLIPTQAQTITDQVAALIDNADVIGGIGILVLLFFSSWAFKILEGALAIIFARSKSRRNRGFWMSALLPYIWIVVIGAGLFALTATVGLLETLSETDLHLFGMVLSLGAAPAMLLKVAGFITEVMLFTAVYRVLPITEVSFKRALAGGVAAAVTRAQKEIENLISDDRIRLALVETGLPAVASAFAQKFGEVKFTSIGGEGSDPSAMIGRGIAQVMTLVKQVGAEVLADRPASPAP